MTLRIAGIVLCALFLLAAAIVVMAGPAGAHHAPSGWQYPPGCCRVYDCSILEPGDVAWTADGWLIVATGEVIGFEDAQDSGDHDWHRCRMNPRNAASKTRNSSVDGRPCLYVPEAEF